jgi:hypothetical protein
MNIPLLAPAADELEEAVAWYAAQARVSNSGSSMTCAWRANASPSARTHGIRSAPVLGGIGWPGSHMG